ncbi:MAG: hypothetical protein RMJ33_09305 [Saprospiraceae bacterium]|nr:hypothetical protein [Saprospiraceae bacterium]
MHLKTNIGYTLPLALALLLVGSCRKDVYEFTPYAPVAEDLSTLFQQVLEPGNTAASFRLEGRGTPLPDTVFILPAGIRLHLADSETLFESESGVPVPCSTCPDLRLEAVFTARRGEAAARQLSQLTYPEGSVLESAGVLHVQAACAGQRLRLRAGRSLKVQIPVATPKNNMAIFTAHTDAQGNLMGWKGGNTPALPVLWLPASGMLQAGYETQVAQMGWVNCARILPEPASPLCVTLPDQFTALNTRVFAIFQNINSAVALSGSLNQSRFCLEKAPLGYPVSIVAVARTGNQYWVAETSTEIGTDTKLALLPKPVAQEDIVALLRKF